MAVYNNMDISWNINNYIDWNNNSCYNFDNLLRLNISKCNIQHLNHISRLFNLEHLICSHNNITTVSSMSLRQLKTLEIGHNQLTKINGLDTPNLITFKFVNNKVKFVNGSFQKLRHFHADSNQISSIKCIFENLITFSASYNNIATLQNLNLSTVLRLSCQNNQISQFTVPDKVQTLNMGNNNLSAISFSHSMKELDVHGNNISILDDICTNGLIFLNCGRNKITLLPINLQNVIFLVYYENNIPDISNVILGKCRELHCAKTNTIIINNNLSTIRKLKCPGNKIASLNFLHDNLIMLDIMANPINNIDISLQNLTVLNCAYTNIMAIQSLPKIKKITHSSYQEQLFSSYNSINKISYEVT